MWQVEGKEVSASWLNTEPIRVLYDFDGPQIFTCKDTSENLFLAYHCGEEGDVWRYLIVPFDAELERELTKGRMNLLDALCRAPAWIFDLDPSWKPKMAWQVDIDTIPASVLPRPGVMLWRHLSPVVGTRT